MKRKLLKPFGAAIAAVAIATSTVIAINQNSGGGSVPPGTCVGAADTPGGADPWGGCWPGAQNTGYPHGLAGDARTPVTLTNYTGSDTISTCGTVIDSKSVVSQGFLLITASNGTHSPDTPCVIIRNSYIAGTVHTDDNTKGPVLIEDTELDTTDEAMTVGIPFIENLGRYNMFSYRVNSHGGDPTIKCAAYCETKDSWAHAPTLGGNNRHYNGIGGNGMEAGSWNIQHNSVACGDWSGQSTGSAPSGDSGCSADMGFYGDFAPVRNITITRNLFRGQTHSSLFNGDNNQSAFCLNPGYYPGKPNPQPTNMTITDNIFQRGEFGSPGNCGVFGPANSVEAASAPEATITWTNNTYTDGTVITRPQE